MRKTREEKAITLIALIITIVVLLILAVVAINAVTGDGIIQHAQNATTKYEEGQLKENTTLSYYQTYLEVEGQVGKWVQNQNSIKKLNSDGTIDEILIGDYVNYISGVSGYTDENGWRVLGIENNQILLVSATNVVTNYTLSGASDYLNNVGITKLNTECEKYINDTYATKARSITVDDINKLTGYKPEVEPWSAGELYQYGNEVTYTLTTSNEIQVTSATKNVKYTKEVGFKLPDGTELTVDNPITLKSTLYTYYPSELGIITDSAIDEMLFKNTNKENGEYWLASSAIATSSGAGFLIRSVHDSHISGKYLYNSGNNDLEYSYCGIRAVVYLKSDVILEKIDGVWNFKSE